jgi:hypothetical protein
MYVRRYKASQQVVSYVAGTNEQRYLDCGNTFVPQITFDFRLRGQMAQ